MAIIVADSVFTVFIGREANPVIVWAMDLLRLDLKSAMIWRVVYCIPFLWVINWSGRSKQVLVLYVAIYAVSAGFVLL